ncbi:MAG: DUF362 domain-containing protein [Planctomycetaceae bacterium]|nr:DUF362 domain-containing protein [Planctomycetaceae bacterium]
MDRREFLERVAAWSTGVCLATPIFRVRDIVAAEANARKRSVVSVVRGKDYAALVDRTLKSLGGIKKFVQEGMRVVVKPNIGWDRPPEQAANTNAMVVEAIVRQCLDAGAKRVWVFDRPCNDPRRSYARSGIPAAVASIGDVRAQCFQLNPKRYVPVRIDGGKSIQQFEFYRDALETECDCYINVPVAKHHALARLTLGLKNTMGVLGGRRGELHKDIGPRLADVNLVIRPKLTIIDATRILLRNGPGGQSLDDVKVLDTLVASTDPVAVDAYATTLFGLKPEDVRSTVAAHQLGLGEMDLSRVKILET